MEKDFEYRNTISPGDMKICLKFGDKQYEVGHIFSYQLQTSAVKQPIFVMGEKRAVASNDGKRSHNGTLIFNVINLSLIHELKKAFAESNHTDYKDGISSHIKNSTFGDYEEFENNIDSLIETESMESDSISAIDLPPFDIIITAPDKYNAKRYSQKKIIGVTIFGQNSAIGLDTVNTQDAYPFMCKGVTPLKYFESESTNLNDAANENLEREGNYVSSFE